MAFWCQFKSLKMIVVSCILLQVSIIVIDMYLPWDIMNSLSITNQWKSINATIVIYINNQSKNITLTHPNHSVLIPLTSNKILHAPFPFFIFQIGFNKCGTKSIRQFFNKNDIPSRHAWNAKWKSKMS
eukprot:760008_1